jgi:hypothetical protein
VPPFSPLDGAFDPGSFRDPLSRVVIRQDQVQRVLSDAGKADWEALAGSRLFRQWTESGRLIGTYPTSVDTEVVLIHDRIPFWSYPYEWSFTMLKEAALLQLELIEAALSEGVTLKDASAYNVQFRGSAPVHIDVGSFTRYEPGEPWLGYGQFCRLFLYPLLIRAHAGVPFQPLLRGSLDGITPAHARALLAGSRRFRPGVMIDVILQARAERSASASKSDVRHELADAGFSAEMITNNLRRLRRVVTATSWEPPGSAWSRYASYEHVAAQRGRKENFVQGVLAQRQRRLVWDLGCNDGYFARVAAKSSDLVVAADADEEVIDRFFRSLAAVGPSNVLPLVINLSDPSPGLGWRGRERRRLEERGRPDLVLVLALVHHLVISANLPLTEVIDWLASLGGEIVFEWVPPDDPMARQLAINKRAGEIHSDYNENELRRLLRGRFVIAAEVGFEGRILLHLVPSI